MVSIFEELFKKEFVIDEPREEVLELDEAELAKTRRPAERPQHERGPMSNDLIEQVSDLLRRHEHLEEMTAELQARSTEPSREQLRKFFRSALPILDSFDRMLKMAEQENPTEETKNWLKSVAAIESRVTDLFWRYGLRTMDPLGKPVDLDHHEVVEVVHNDSIEDETVVEVRQKGYLFDGKVLRDAKVVVAKNERS